MLCFNAGSELLIEGFPERVSKPNKALHVTHGTCPELTCV